MRHLMRGALLFSLHAALVACSGGKQAARPDDSAPNRESAAATSSSVVTIKEAFITPFDSSDNIDSPAVYHGGNETHWVIATAKTSDALVVYDAATGAVVRRYEGTGSGMASLDRPNGILVTDSLLLIVERDNHRVHAFVLPAIRSVGIFGEKELRKPYGLAAVADSSGWRLFVTDNYETAMGDIPPRGELGQRVKEFRLAWRDGIVAGSFVRAFGDTTVAGAVRTVESIVADPPANRLLIAEETPDESQIKVYDLAGAFTGKNFGLGMFPQQAEGLALYACGATDGYWITTDQGDGTNTFHVFDRKTLAHVGAFTGARTRRTDGVALTQRGFGAFPAGAFYASHLDGAIAAFSWRDIAVALGLRSDCTGA